MPIMWAISPLRINVGHDLFVSHWVRCASVIYRLSCPFYLYTYAHYQNQTVSPPSIIGITLPGTTFFILKRVPVFGSYFGIISVKISRHHASFFKSNSNSKKVYCCTRKYKSQFTNADINSHSVHGNGGKHAVCTFFICAHMLLPYNVPSQKHRYHTKNSLSCTAMGATKPKWAYGPQIWYIQSSHMQCA